VFLFLPYKALGTPIMQLGASFQSRGRSWMSIPFLFVLAIESWELIAAVTSELLSVPGATGL